MIAFWIAAAAVSALAAALVLRGAARPAPAGDETLSLHKRQLAEIDELAERGLLAEGEVRSARTEAARRLLSAADEAATATRQGGRRTALIVAGIAPLAAVVIYVLVGAPDQPDQPYAKRIAEWRASDPRSLEPDAIAAVLEAAAKEKPNDPEPLRNLAILKSALDDAPGAQAALRRALRVAPDRVDLWTALGEAFVLEARGQINDDAVRAFDEAVKRDPKALTPRYYLGRGRILKGEAAEGLTLWRGLLPDIPAGDPRRTVLEGEIAAVARDGRLPMPEPEAAQPQVSPADIQGMVDGLAARLKEQPDDPEGWVRLVRAYAVLGDAAKRDATLAEARARYKDQPQVLDALTAAAEVPR
ncbi:c-type cytochrome biogenesis protein CcmI [Caulobacter segnis]|uniref:c-type cytochrome biogenesis protein CcmI n=1 Tax=Caulobacter segnis TaxID=88688 RepID=UPI002410908C|nr:c-type cytochrome biogenesis protein CcmI [Caulobacter segnis]MDG2523293.1 c-type cytochrome biogenesis protein CcmI [Caulobacter segnis]